MIDNIIPTVDITNPADGDSVNNLVEVWGTASDDSLDNYVVELRRYSNGGSLISTTEEANSSVSVTSGILATIDVSSFEDGDILEIELRAKDLAGNEDSKQITVTVDKSLIPISSDISIASPLSGGYADEQVENIIYTPSSPITDIYTFIDNDLIREQLFTDIPYIDTLLYEETSTHSLVLVGEDASGNLSFSDGLVVNPLLISTLDAGDIASSQSVENNNGIRLSIGQTNGSFTMNSVAFGEKDIAYKIVPSCTTPVELEVSLDGGTTFTSVEADKYYLIRGNASVIVRCSLDTGDEVKGIEIDTARVQNPHNVEIQTVDKPTNLRIVKNSLGKIEITWTQDTDPSVLYDVYRGTSSSFIPNITNQIQTQMSDNFYADNNVSQGKTYYYKVIATKTFAVVPPYISFRESESADIKVQAYAEPVAEEIVKQNYYNDGDDGADKVWGDPEEIADAKEANAKYGSGWTVNGDAPAPTGDFEVNQSLLNGRAYCSIGFEPINFVSGNFFIKQNDATYTSSPEVNSNILRTYNTQTAEKNGPFGNGWAWHYSTQSETIQRWSYRYDYR